MKVSDREPESAMKYSISILCVLPLFLFLSLFSLSSCVTTEDVDLSHLERNPDVLGQRTGRADALAGRDDDYSRHLHKLHPDADEDDFEDAYEDAYEEGEDELEEREDRYDSYSGRDYDSGYDQGERDRQRGLSRDPRRHEGSAGLSRSWIDGYQDGWNER